MTSSPVLNPFDHSFRQALIEDAPKSTPVYSLTPMVDPPPFPPQSPQHCPGNYEESSTTADVFPLPSVELPSSDEVLDVPNNLDGCFSTSLSWQAAASPHTHLRSCSSEDSGATMINAACLTPQPLQRLPSNLSLLRCESVEEFLRMNNLTLGSSGTTGSLIQDLNQCFVGLEDGATVADGLHNLFTGFESTSSAGIPTQRQLDSHTAISNCLPTSYEASQPYLTTSEDARMTSIFRFLSRICTDLDAHLRATCAPMNFTTHSLPTAPPVDQSVPKVVSSVPPEPISTSPSQTPITPLTGPNLEMQQMLLTCPVTPISPPSSISVVDIDDNSTASSRTSQHQKPPRKRPFCGDSEMSTTRSTESFARDAWVSRIRQRFGGHLNTVLGSNSECSTELVPSSVDSCDCSETCAENCGAADPSSENSEGLKKTTMSFRERNRLAAKKARRKKKLYTQELEQELMVLKKAFDKMKNRNEALRKENIDLRHFMSQLLQHPLEPGVEVAVLSSSKQEPHSSNSTENATFASTQLNQVIFPSSMESSSNASVLFMGAGASSRTAGQATTQAGGDKGPRYIILPSTSQGDNKVSSSPGVYLPHHTFHNRLS